ncbi:unnamed protein product [Spirodela intermedia]|uniref:Uncharacterized protein n=1 Tax=Spirodela intermedia TaxID=51605 RepID=A0A7I8I7M6_SPIIN|nr:unnamed protein product [Spirodela intermedia]CAA6653626.1 unnamed protein product [Spirodela intermedia]
MTSSIRGRERRRKAHYKCCLPGQKKVKAFRETLKTWKTDTGDGDDGGATQLPSGCRTPDAGRFYIRESVECPPAPKKKTLTVRCLPMMKSTFFSPPDLELFFSIALRNLSG